MPGKTPKKDSDPGEVQKWSEIEWGYDSARTRTRPLEVPAPPAWAEGLRRPVPLARR
jgi:hypothetical protein